MAVLLCIRHILPDDRETAVAFGSKRPKYGICRVLYLVRCESALIGSSGCWRAGGLVRGTLAGDRGGSRRPAGTAARACLREASLRERSGRSPVQVWAGGSMTVNLQVKRLVRTLSVPVRGVSRFASLPARTYSGQGKLFT